MAGRPEDAVRVAFQVSGSPGVRGDALTAAALCRLAPCAPGLIADLECVTGMTLPAEQWGALTAPVTLLRGERSTAEYVRSIELRRAVFPSALYVVLPGQAHFPHDMAPVAKLLAA